LSKIEDHITAIAKKIYEGKVGLFLGPEASLAAGELDQSQLVAEIKSKFPKLDQNMSGMLNVCEDFMETPEYKLEDLEKFITDKLSPLQPTNTHLSLVKYKWSAIFTTNFDDLIEKAYLADNSPEHNFSVINYPHKVPITDHSKVLIFKLMGTISTRKENKMVLCRSDFTKMLSKRAEYLENLEDYVMDGAVLFVGYSASDRLVTDMIDVVKDKIGLHRLPYSYMLLKNANLSEKDKFRLDSHKIIPVNGTFEEFFEKLASAKVIAAAPTVETEAKGKKIRVEGKDIFLSTRELDMYHDFFEVIHQDLLNAQIKNKEDFFKGAINDFGAYAEDLDFKRDVYLSNEYKNLTTQQTIKETVFGELRKIGSEENAIILVTGPPGVGKSVLLRRLAFDVSSQGIAPVVLFDRTRSYFDLKLLSSMLVDFDRKFDATNDRCSTHRLKPLIIIDDPSVDPIQVRDYLTSRRRLALILTAFRDNELNDKRLNVLPKSHIFRIREKLSPDEKTRIIKHLFKHSIISSPDENWDLLLDREFKDSFFATLYMLVQPTRKPLNEIIYDQYSKLDPKAKKAFAYICTFHQFDSPINLELLVRALKCGYYEFVNDILPKTRGLVFDESTKSTLLYTTHHRIIAKKTIEFFFASTKHQKDLLLEVFSEVNFNNKKEKELVEKLLINHFSSYSKSTDLTRTEKIEIFEKVTSQVETKVLLHHLGILLMDEGTNIARAEEILAQALTLHEVGNTPQRTELDQNIETSLGVLHSRIAIKNSKAKFAFQLVQQEIQLAENHFLKARFGGYPNQHSYHAHAKMYLQLADEEKDELRKQSYYSSAITIIDDARDNLNEDQFELVAELEVQLYQKVGKVELSMDKAAEIAKKYQSAKGYTLIASTLIDKSESLNTWVERAPFLKRAMLAIDRALKEFPQDERSLILKAKLTRRLSPGENSLYLETLQNWYNNARSPNIVLLFELGMSSFKDKQYEYSKKIFEKLENERISGGIRERFSEELYVDLHGKPLRFIGVVTSIESRHDGYIRIDSLPELSYPLHFRPIICPFQAELDDTVEFNIAFDFLGARAVRVNRI